MISLALIAVAFSITAANPSLPVYAELAQANNVAMPAVSVRVIDRDCPQYGDGSRVSCVYRAKPNRIFTSQREPYVFLHELGHVYDFTKTMKPWQRRAFRVIMRYYSRPWLSTDKMIGAGERFADAYASCALGLVPLKDGITETSWIIGGYGYNTTVEQHRQVCKLIAPRR